MPNAEDLEMGNEEKGPDENAEFGDTSIQAKFADKLEPVLNLIKSTSNNQLAN